MAHDSDRLVCVGAIAGAFGVRGEARVKSFCAEPADIARYGPLSTADGRSFALTITRTIGDGFAVRLSGVTTREDAEALRGTRLHVPRERLAPPAADEFYHADLIGLEAVDTGGAVLGRVRAVHDFGAGDVVEIAGAPERMVPFTRAAVPMVDIAAGRLVVDLDAVEGGGDGRGDKDGDGGADGAGNG